jgi:hypothetical protein
MNASTEWAQDADPKIADLVLETFDDDAAVARNFTRRLVLLVDVLDELLRSRRIEMMRELKRFP